MPDKTDTIILQSDRDKVRERPGMYIGDNSEIGLATIVREIIDNAVDEYPNYSDPTKPIEVVLHADNSLSVRDHGRGISPYESKKYKGKIEERLAYTVIGAGGKFKANREQNGNKFSGGLNGTGSAATNFMSEFFDVTIFKDGHIFHDRFENGGIPVEKLVNGQLPKKKQKGTPETGTLVHFKADATVMRVTTINARILEQYFRQTAYLHQGLHILFTNERDGDTEPTDYYSENGLFDYINDLATDENGQVVDFLIKPFDVRGSQSVTVLDEEIDMEAHIAVAFTKNGQFATESFTNGIHNSLGGTHVAGFNNGLLRLLKHYYDEFSDEINKKYKKQIDLIKKVNKVDDVSSLFKSRDLAKRVFVVIDFKHSNPILQPQTKDKLASDEARTAVSNIFYDNAMMYLDKNITAVQRLLNDVIAEMYDKAKDEDSNIQIDKKTETLAKSTKLAAARGTYPELMELILVEGDSAAGSLKANRDANFQAVLPLRGKVLNVQKATLKDALANLEISTIFSILGCGYGRNYDESKLKYQKIIIATDQDVDGLHIRTLLLTLFLKYTKLVQQGHIYFLDTPLFVNAVRPTKAKPEKEVYTYSNEEQNEFIEANRKRIIEVSRNKGLGELSTDQVITTILTPETRKLTQIVITEDDEDEAYEIVEILMGDDAQGRKRMIVNRD